MTLNHRTNTRDLIALRVATLHIKLATLEAQFAILRLKANFHPDQPRVPRGNPDGGQWTLVGRRPWPMRTRQAINLTIEENKGGHKIERHVGKSHEYLRNRIEEGFARIGPLQAGDNVVGTFENIVEATYYINKTIESNSETVDLIRSGQARHAIITSYFDGNTGHQMFITK